MKLEDIRKRLAPPLPGALSRATVAMDGHAPFQVFFDKQTGAPVNPNHKFILRFRDRVVCSPSEPNDRCGGCDDCMAMQFRMSRDELKASSYEELEKMLAGFGLRTNKGMVGKKKVLVDALLSAQEGLI